MFDKKDFNHIEKMQNTMADGIVDASGSHDMLEKLIDIFISTDFIDDESRMEMMMHCVNLIYETDEDGDDVLVEDNVFYVILGLCFNYANIMHNLSVDGFDIKDYLNFLKTDVLPSMKEEYKALPYWDVDEN